MTNFLQFLNEANAAGSKFEKEAANAVQAWIDANGLGKKFKATRFQTVNEDDGSRDEDFSDVVVDDLETGEQFFIECKQNASDNIITPMFDIREVDSSAGRSFYFVPVEGKSRDEISASEDDPRNVLAYELSHTDGFQQFNDFLAEPNELLDGICPADFLLDRDDVTDQLLTRLMKAYNKLVDDGKTEADCKKFDGKLIRESTRNMLAVALAWRLADLSHTWDICKMEDFDIGNLIRSHYMEQKAIPAKYIQLGRAATYVIDANDNPLGVDCQELPKEILGSFWLKFTPRFGTGSMYITPRSTVSGELPATTSFMNKKKLPAVKK